MFEDTRQSARQAFGANDAHFVGADLTVDMDVFNYSRRSSSPMSPGVCAVYCRRSADSAHHAGASPVRLSDFRWLERPPRSGFAASAKALTMFFLEMPTAGYGLVQRQRFLHLCAERPIRAHLHVRRQNEGQLYRNHQNFIKDLMPDAAFSSGIHLVSSCGQIAKGEARHLLRAFRLL